MGIGHALGLLLDKIESTAGIRFPITTGHVDAAQDFSRRV